MKIYLMSVAFSILSISISSVALDNRMKNEGYKTVKAETSFAETLLSIIRLLILSAIPLLNVFFGAFSIIGYDNIYRETINKLTDNGEITRPKENEPVSTWDIRHMPSDSLKRTVTYEKMTTAEKIAWLTEEKNKLLSGQETSATQEEGPVLSRSPQHERGE